MPLERELCMNNKGQEEITGFVLVIIVVSVVGMLLLTLTLRNDDNTVQLDSFTVRQFLDSSMKVTSDCSIRSNVDYASLDDLIRTCYSNPGNVCYNSGKQVCEIMNDTLNDVLLSLPGFYTGYKMNISFEKQVAGKTESYLPVYYFESGNCSQQYRAGEYLTRVSNQQGVLVSTLVVC